jgi:hypothetical protein
MKATTRLCRRRRGLAVVGLAVAVVVVSPAAQAENPGYTGPTAPTGDVAPVNEALDPSSFSLPPGAQPPDSSPPDEMIQAQGTGGIDFGDAGLGAAATAGGALLLTAAADATSRRRRHRGSLSGSDS